MYHSHSTALAFHAIDLMLWSGIGLTDLACCSITIQNFLFITLLEYSTINSWQPLFKGTQPQIQITYHSIGTMNVLRMVSLFKDDAIVPE